MCDEKQNDKLWNHRKLQNSNWPSISDKYHDLRNRWLKYIKWKWNKIWNLGLRSENGVNQWVKIFLQIQEKYKFDEPIRWWHAKIRWVLFVLKIESK